MSMKKLIIPILISWFIFGCSDNKEKNKVEKEGKEQNSDSSESKSGGDKAIKEWLVGKEWKAEHGGAPFSILKVFSMDSCAFTASRKYRWSFKNGRFIMLAEWPLTRINDTTFTIYVEPTQKTYTYKFVNNL